MNRIKGYLKNRFVYSRCHEGTDPAVLIYVKWPLTLGFEQTKHLIILQVLLTEVNYGLNCFARSGP